jgi:hypothetical protein
MTTKQEIKVKIGVETMTTKQEIKVKKLVWEDSNGGSIAINCPYYICGSVDINFGWYIIKHRTNDWEDWIGGNLQYAKNQVQMLWDEYVLSLVEVL